jgi:hypothetical protein
VGKSAMKVSGCVGIHSGLLRRYGFRRDHKFSERTVNIIPERRIERDELDRDWSRLRREREDRVSMLFERMSECLSNPPYSIRDEGDVSFRVELLDSSHKSQRAFLDEVKKA